MKPFFQRNYLPKPSLSKDFALVAILLALSIFTTLGWLGWTIYNQQKTDRLYSYSTEGDRLDAAIRESFDYVTHYARFLGEKIIEKGSANPSYIAELFFSKKGQVDPEERQLYSWTKFDWIDPQKMLTVSTQHGVLKEKRDISIRSYLEETPIHPWKLRFSEPAVGIPSGQWIIPTGVGIKDDKGKFYGTIGTGFSIERLKAKLELSPTMIGYSFILLDKKFRFILQSSGSNCSTEEMNRLKKGIAVLPSLSADAAFLKKPIQCGRSKYLYYRTVTNYPFYFLIGEDITIAKDKLKDVVYPRAIEFFSMWGIGLALLYFFRIRLIRPIISITEAAKKIAQGEEVVVPQGPYPEINLLASQLEDIQDMRKELSVAKEEAEKAHANVKQANESLEERVFERTIQLEEALDAKSEFLRNISHEIRSPLVGIMTKSDALANEWDKYTEDDRRQQIKESFDLSRRLFSLVSNLLDLSKMEMGKMHYDMKRNCNITKLVQEMIVECQSVLLECKAVLKLEAPDAPILVTLDETRMTQVLRNLYTNAIKFTHDGTINATLTRKGSDSVLFSLHDEGIGIPEAELSHIFDLFTQSSRTKTNAGGTGLGLSIAKQIIDAHHGHIWAGNNPGKGCTLNFEIPLHQPNEQELASKEEQEASLPVIPDKVHALIIDDENHCLMGLKLYLSGDGHNTMQAQDGHLGISLLLEHYDHIDMVFLDMMMPELNGLEVIREIKKYPHLAHIPIILQTGCSDQQELNTALALGVVHIMSKPYKRQDVSEAIQIALRKKYSNLQAAS